MDADAMNDHWKKVERDRKAKYGGEDDRFEGDSAENEFLERYR